MGTTDMGNAGNTDDDTAAGRLHTLATYYRQHRVTGPAGHSYISSAPRPTPADPAAPINVDIVDHIDACVREIVDETLAVNPDAGPLPPVVAGAYGWYLENTTAAPEYAQQRRDVIIYRQNLEHAIALGEYKVIRPHRCPQCRTFGLFWRRDAERAVCTNRRCLTPEGLSNKWTLAQLAYEHVTETYEKAVRDCAT
jgi:hypothetical protein